MPNNLETLLREIGVSIMVICENYEPAELSIHELTISCKPIKVISVSVAINGESD